MKCKRRTRKPKNPTTRKRKERPARKNPKTKRKKKSTMKMRTRARLTACAKPIKRIKNTISARIISAFCSRNRTGRTSSSPR